MPKLNEKLGNFTLSLINESDSVAIDDGINTDFRHTCKFRGGNQVLQWTTSCKYQQ